MQEFKEFLLEYTLISSIPIFSFLLFYVMILLGWFFSTDYYDKFNAIWDDPAEDLIFFHGISGVVSVLSILIMVNEGLSSNAVLLINAVLFVVFIIPCMWLYILKVRKNIRIKRGKFK